MLDDVRFILRDVLGETETYDDVLVGAAELCRDVIAPLNAPGDLQGAVWRDGAVTTPDGFKEAFRAFADGGWIGLTADPEHGGSGLPHLVGAVLEELLCAANLSFSTYAGLTSSAYRAVALHGDAEQRARLLPPLARGTSTGTMCLTEAHAGTDLGLLRTSAEPDGAGRYRITGQKIFITAGEHDLTEDILHLVLARLPDAPAGTRGISLFAVPRRLRRRHAERASVPLDRAQDGHPRLRDLHARLRRGGRRADRRAGPRHARDVHDDERRPPRRRHPGPGAGAGGVRARGRVRPRAAAGARAAAARRAPTSRPTRSSSTPTCAGRCCAAARRSRAAGRWRCGWRRRSTGPRRRRGARDDLVALMTPIVKAGLTDLGTEAPTSRCGVFGGHGYIRENGMEQLVRDARITSLYEGTNGVQALDLVGRKLPEGAGRLLRRFFHPSLELLDEACADARLADIAGPARDALHRLRRVHPVDRRPRARRPRGGRRGGHRLPARSST